MTDTSGGTVLILPTSGGEDTKQLLRDREIKYEQALVDFDAVDTDASTRNQARLLPIHQETVEIYRAAMEAGDRFPPIVVNATKKPYVILDGNHRIFAAKMAGFTSMEMLLAKGTSAQLELFTYEANAKHGLPTTMEERIRQGVYLVSLGNQALTVAKALSIPERKLWQAMAEDRATKRLSKIGIDASLLSLYQRRRMAAIKSDNVLRPFAEIVIKANVGATEMSQAIVGINDLTTESEQVAYVERMRDEYEPVIQTTAGGTLEIPRDIVRLRMAARLLRNIDDASLNDSIHRIAPEFRVMITREVVESVSSLLTASKILSSYGQS